MVTGEHLISALAIQQYGDAILFREPHDAPLCIHTCGRERLFLMPEQITELLKELLRGGPDVVTFNPILTRDEIHPLAFVSRSIIETGGEGLLHCGIWQQVIDHTDNCAGVEPA